MMAAWRIALPSTFRDLIVWNKAMDLVTAIYACTECFPQKEQYGLTSQLRRAAVSVPSNIAEGHGRKSKGEFRQFLSNARGSLMELETQIEIAFRLRFINANDRERVISQVEEIARLTNGLWNSLK
jgi:four helix bundle protein